MLDGIVFECMFNQIPFVLNEVLLDMPELCLVLNEVRLDMPEFCLVLNDVRLDMPEFCQNM
jgi:hypothetical protein